MRAIAEQCLIGTSIPRAVTAVLSFPAILFAIHLQWVFFGRWPIWDFRHFLHPNEVPLSTMVLGIVVVSIFCARYLKHSLRTLRGGSCALAVRGDELTFYGRTIVPLNLVEGVSVVNNLFRKGLIVTLRDGSRTYISTIMSHNPNPRSAVQLVQAYL